MNTSLSIQFLGGAGTVTGSKYLIQSGKRRILVDCGLFQGIKELRLKNRKPLPVDPADIHAVILTHAHLDHTGYLPLLVKRGFRGKVYCTQPTAELTQVILMDSAKLQEMDAEYANRKGFSKHHPALPLYTQEDAERAIHFLTPMPPHQWHKIFNDISFQFKSSGHILGSAFIELEIQGKRIVFSGDLGRQKPFLLNPPESIERADYLLIESTYGDRLHNPESPSKELARVIHDVISRKGHLLIASFAVGRAQDLLFLISQLKRENKIPDIPVYVDSPMAKNALDIFHRYSKWHALSPTECAEICNAAHVVNSREESKHLLELEQSSIVISASGMLSGGRVLFHLENRLSEEKNTILLVGFQAAGTRGRLLRSGARELKMHGRYIPVKAHIEEITTLSAHADQSEIITWLRGFKSPPKMTFIIHGEPQASDALRLHVQDELGWSSCVPNPMDEVKLD